MNYFFRKRKIILTSIILKNLDRVARRVTAEICIAAGFVDVVSAV